MWLQPGFRRNSADVVSNLAYRGRIAAAISGRNKIKVSTGSDSNRDDDEEYSANLIARVVMVSVETVRIMKSLPDVRLI
jgi:hypothetical protein